MDRTPMLRNGTDLLAINSATGEHTRRGRDLRADVARAASGIAPRDSLVPVPGSMLRRWANGRLPTSLECRHTFRSRARHAGSEAQHPAFMEDSHEHEADHRPERRLSPCP